MSTERTTGLTYEDLLEMFPEEDNVRRELIGGELILSPAPSFRHQQVVVRMVVALDAYARAHDGEALVAPFDVKLTDRDVVEPDVLYFGREARRRIEQRYVQSAPDLVVEVSSPTTRRVDLVRKRDLYVRFGVPEYWFVDLDADRVEVFHLADGRYGPSSLLGRADTLKSSLLPGLELSVDAILGPPPG